MKTIQDEVNEKTVSLCIAGGKISASILRSAMRKALVKIEQKMPVNGQGKEQAVYRGKQSMKTLIEQDCQLSNIEITDGNIKSFEKYARKYHIDFSLKKDTSISPPRYFVFFKARDVDVMTAAFKEYSGKQLHKGKKPSVRKKLELAKERMAKHREREKNRQRDRGQEH